jgi:hypothetical protein
METNREKGTLTNPQLELDLNEHFVGEDDQATIGVDQSTGLIYLLNSGISVHPVYVGCGKIGGCLATTGSLSLLNFTMKLTESSYKVSIIKM